MGRGDRHGHQPLPVEHGRRLPKRPPPRSRREQPPYRLLREDVGGVRRLGRGAARAGIGVAVARGTDRCAASWPCRCSRASACSASIVLENHEREHAFGDADLRLLHDRRRTHGRRARERAAVRRDPAPAQGNRAAQRRAGGDQRHPAGARSRARPAGDHRRRRRQAARGLRAPTIVGIALLDRGARRASPIPTCSSTACAAVRRRCRRQPDVRHRRMAMRTGSTLVVGTAAELDAFQASTASAPASAGRRSTTRSSRAGAARRAGIGLICSASRARRRLRRPSDVRLLATVVASLSVALENAQSFEAERAARRRAGGDQQHPAGLAGELDFQAIVDARRRQAARGVRAPATCGIRWFDETAGTATPATSYEHGVRRRNSTPCRTRRASPMTRRCAPCGVLVADRRTRPATGRPRCTGHRPAAVVGCSCRSSRATGVIGVDPPRELRARERLRRRRRAPAHDGRGEHGRGAGERAPVRRDAAAAEGDRAAQRRAGGDQQHPAGRWARSSTSRRSSTSSATSCARSSPPAT